jgi:UDP-N-acetylmuramoyl-tripeptide--D-alanyl-D-alanine ligase
MMDIQKLYERFLKSSGAFTDTRQILPNGVFFALKGANYNGNQYALAAIEDGASFAVVDDSSLPVHPDLVQVNDVLSTLQTLANHHRRVLGIPVVALTGSNGKTTTKELMHAVLAEKFNVISTAGNFNNHIGVPLTLLRMQAEHEIAIVEMGANHQREIAQLCEIAEPDYGLITNYGLAHLEGFGGKEGIIKGKSEMFDFLRGRGQAFVRADDPVQVEKSAGQNRFFYGPNATDYPVEEVTNTAYATIVLDGDAIISQLVGSYNARNMTVAAAIGMHFGVEPLAIASALKTYQPRMNRSEMVDTGRNKLIMDAYNANPSSMRVALENLGQQKGDLVAVLGDMFELGTETQHYHQEVVDHAQSSVHGMLIFIGKNFMDVRNSRSLFFEDTLAARAYLSQNPLVGKTILLKGSRGMRLEVLKDLL